MSQAMVWPDHLLSLAEWDDFPEDVSRRFELVEGVLQMTPRPSVAHQTAIKRLAQQLDRAWLPAGLETVFEVDVLLVAAFPPVVRAPDLVVAAAAALGRGSTRLAAADVVLAVEIVSPGSARTDRISKLADYADAGIPHYWIIDIDGPVTLDAFDLIDGRYQPSVVDGHGTVHLTTPATVTVDLAGLRLPGTMAV